MERLRYRHQFIHSPEFIHRLRWKTFSFDKKMATLIDSKTEETDQVLIFLGLKDTHHQIVSLQVLKTNHGKLIKM